MSRISSCRGWSSGGCGARDDGGVHVNVRGVCACVMRRKCESVKSCILLFEDGGEEGANRTLAELMGRKKLPKSWLSWRNFQARLKRQAEMDRFARKYFKKCKPVVVEIHRR